MDKVLLCMPYFDSGKQGRELEMSLTGWKKFCKFPFKIAIIGDRNPIIDKFDFVEWVPCPRVEGIEGMYRPHLDRANKFLTAYQLYHENEGYEGFFHICDDHYPVHEFDLDYLKQTYYLQPRFVGDLNRPSNTWQHDLAKTSRLLTSNGIKTVNFTTHFPQYYEFEKYKEIVEKFDLTHKSYVIENIYYNYFKLKPAAQADTIRLGVWCAEDSGTKLDVILNDANDKRKFIACSTKGFNQTFQDKLCKHLGI